jgi:biotin carboxyl carrier protein
VREYAATKVRGELALHVTRQPTALWIGVALLPEHRLRMLRDELVQHRALRCPQTIAAEPPSGLARRTFEDAVRDHHRVHWNFRPAIDTRSIATFRSSTSDPRTTATTSARAPPFVTAGAALAAGTTICLLEVMKTFHRVTYAGAPAQVKSVLVADGDAGTPWLALE